MNKVDFKERIVWFSDPKVLLSLTAKMLSEIKCSASFCGIGYDQLADEPHRKIGW